MGINLDSVEIETEGELDLRGFLGIDENVKPGYDSIQYTVRLKGNGTPEQFQAVHQNVVKTSPNYFNIARPVTVKANLVVG
jgi:OsmC-like protein